MMSCFMIFSKLWENKVVNILNRNIYSGYIYIYIAPSAYYTSQSNITRIFFWIFVENMLNIFRGLSQENRQFYVFIYVCFFRLEHALKYSLTNKIFLCWAVAVAVAASTNQTKTTTTTTEYYYSHWFVQKKKLWRERKKE